MRFASSRSVTAAAVAAATSMMVVLAPAGVSASALAMPQTTTETTIDEVQQVDGVDGSDGSGSSSSDGSGGGDGNGDVACNNSPSLCSKRYSDITHLGAHNSYALRDESTGNSISGNQYYNATLALDAGLRLLQVQTHPDDEGGSEVKLCHSTCGLLDAGPLQDWLVDINAWMDDNPNDVVTLLIVNAGKAPAATLQRILDDSGIGDKAYPRNTSTPSGEVWPTLQDMIDAGTRLVTFSTNVNNDPSAPAIRHEFDYVFETPFAVTSLDGFNCTVERPTHFTDGASALGEGFLGLVNHFKYSQAGAGIQIPDMDTINTVNSADTSEEGNLGRHLNECSREWGQKPAFVLIDFWNEENPLDAVDSVNDVSDPEGRQEAQDSPDNAAALRAGGCSQVGAVVAVLAALMLVV